MDPAAIACSKPRPEAMTPKGHILTPPTPAPASAEVARLLDCLPTLTSAQLRHEWQRLYRTPSPRLLSRDLLQRAIAHKIQEQAYGGLSQAARRRLQTLARAIAQQGEVALKPSPGQKPGARLVRQWRGETHCVLVLDNGFLYQDQRYRSLTAIARAITGAHWSGPRFFGLGSQAGPDPEAEHG
jgi:Protein of unknown function (DUF2924)